MISSLSAMGAWDLTSRGTNLLDTGAPFYDVFACADGRWVSVGAIETQFYAELVRLTGFREGQPADERFSQGSAQEWPAMKKEWAALWLTRTRDEWAELLAGTDACVQPVLDWAERDQDEHLRARGTIVEHDGLTQAAPAPRLSGTPLSIARSAPVKGEHTREIGRGLGLSEAALDALLADRILSEPQGDEQPPS
jgi:alpha-methylacyl-CoA racemase